MKSQSNIYYDNGVWRDKDGKQVLPQSNSQELTLNEILHDYGAQRHQVMKGSTTVKEHSEAWKEAKAKLLQLALSCLMERPEYILGEPATTRASKSGQSFAIDTMEQKIKERFS